GTTTRNSDGSMSVNGGSNRTFVNRNGARTYDSTGRLVAYSIQRGNVLRVYDSSGRLTNRAVIRRTTTGHTIEDRGGRFYARKVRGSRAVARSARARLEGRRKTRLTLTVTGIRPLRLHGSEITPN